MDTQSQKDKRLPIPESLSAKFALLGRLPYDRRARRKHSLVYGFILDWYYSKYGNALASVRFVVDKLKERDPAGRGLSSRHVHSALKDLTSWNYLEAKIGSGRAASRYIPNWDLVCTASSVSDVGDGNVGDNHVSPVSNDCVSDDGNDIPNCVSPAGNQDPSTPTRFTEPGTGVEGLDYATTTTTTALAGEADDGAAKDGFEELYREYGLRTKKAAARKAFEKISPNPAEHSKMMQSAHLWREAWEAQKKPDAPRKHLHTWLKDECYDEDPPRGFKKEKQRTEETLAEPTAEVEPPWKTHIGVNIVEVVRASMDESDKGTVLTVELSDQNEGGYLRIERLLIGAHDPKDEMFAKRRLAEICKAAEITTIEDSDELLGLPLIANVQSDGAVRYQSLSANDNHASINAVVA